MDRNRESTMQFLCLLQMIALVAGYPMFQQQIPNGEMVPHPCKPNYLWRGVGHLNLLGGGPRNAFGLAFDQNDKVWNEAICRLDSDGDGKTNGEELGDPDCTWTPGTAPKYTVGLSHPGVCEPIDSEQCKGKTNFVVCDDAPEFDCPAVDEPETFNYTVTIPKTPVPAEETSYVCMNFEFPADREYHLVASTPVIDEVDVMHHIIAYACPGVSEASKLEHPLNTPYNCKMSADEKCTDIVSIWAVGVAGNCGHEKAGFLIGGAAGYKYAAFQMHWNNPVMSKDYVDASGMNFYLTPKLRQFNSGVTMIGQHFIEIPPGKEAYDVEGSCMPECTSQMTSSIFVTSAFNHMHYLGKSQVTELIRNGEKIKDLAVDEMYSYDSPVTYDHKEEIEIKRGDQVKTTCTFKSTSRTTVTRGGEGTSDEMCYVFLTYYPKENMPAATCTQSRSISDCDRYDGVIQGCDTKVFFNSSHPTMAAIYAGVSEKCSIAFCKPDCREYVKRVKMNPCFQGDVTIEMRNYIRRMEEYKAETLMFYAMLDSCDKELATEACGLMPTSTGSWFTASVSLSLAAALTVFNI